jgi:hypothetical protein
MEPVGLAVGIAGLAGLFSTCVECFNIVQRGRYLGRDYFILETKYTNQRLRLQTWGRACGLCDVGTAASSTLAWNDEVRVAVGDTLFQIASLFQDHRTLRKRYGLSVDQSDLGSPHGAVSAPGMLAALTSKFRATGLVVSELAVFAPPGRSFAKRPGISASVRWAVDDKHKFADLVQHLKDFIDDLEALTADLDIRQLQRELIRAEVESIADVAELEMIEQARVGGRDAIADAASLRLSEIQNGLDVASLLPLAQSSNGEVSLSTTAVDTTDNEWDIVESGMPDRTPSSDMCYQVLHRVTCESEPAIIFFDRPSYHSGHGGCSNDQWLEINPDFPSQDPPNLHLSGRRRLTDLESYLEHNPQLSFLVFYNYTCSHDTGSSRQPVKPDPLEPTIYLVSEALCSLLASLFDKDHRAMAPGMELEPPHIWFYHGRQALATKLASTVGEHPATGSHKVADILCNLMQDAMARLYSEVESTLPKLEKFPWVTWEQLPFLFVSPSHRISCYLGKARY